MNGDYAGEIIIGTKIDNSGLKSGLKETEKIAKDFDKNNTIEPSFELNTEDATKSMEAFEESSRVSTETMKSLNKQVEKFKKKALEIEQAKIFEEFGNNYDNQEYLDSIGPALGEEEVKKKVENARKIINKQFKDKPLEAPINFKTDRKLVNRKFETAQIEPGLIIKKENIQVEDGIEDPILQKLNYRLQKEKARISDYEGKISEGKSKVDEIQKEIDKIREESGYLSEQYELWLKIDEKISNRQTLTGDEAMHYQTFVGADETITKLEEKAIELEKKQNKINESIERWTQSLKVAKLNYSEIEKKIEDIKAKQDETGSGNVSKNISNINKSVNKMEKGFSGLLKKALKIGLALVGIQTVLSVITRAFNTLSQYNDELGTKIQQMRLVLAVALEPVINWIVNLLHQILSLINQIYSAFTGISLFGRASELWSQKMAKNMSSGASSAKEMKKQLAGFDEMNVLSDNETSGGGGGGGSSMEPWDLEEVDIGWMKWIKENGDIIAGIIVGIATAWALMKLGIKGIKALGIGVIVAGIIMLIIDIIKYLKDPSWENFGKIIRDIGIILVGIGIVIGGIPGLIVAIIGVIVMLVGIIIEHWDKIKEKILGVAEWLHNKAEELKSKGQGFLGGIFELFSKGVEDIVFIFENIVGTIKKVFDDIIQLFKDAFNGDWSAVLEDAKKIFSDILDGIVELAKKTWERFKENLQIVKEMITSVITAIYDWLYEKIYDIVMKIYEFKEKVKQFIYEGIQYIINKIMEIVGKVQAIKDKIHNIIDLGVNWIKGKFNQITGFVKDMGIAIGDFFSGAIKGAVNGVLSWAESKINWFIDKINSVISIINKIPGVSISRLSRVSLPRLATGGIINQPGRGVPVGGAIGGEAGREGILPLTDERAMAQLGREIGRWITVNATIPVSVGNRQIAREVRQFMADQDFATNR